MSQKSTAQGDTPAATPGARLVREVAVDSGAPLFVNPEWRSRFPWLLQATTGRSSTGNFDLSFFGTSAAGTVLGNWRTVRQASGFGSVMHARQVHGREVRTHTQHSAGITIQDNADGHCTEQAGLLLAVSIADCVPIFLVAPGGPAIALLHAGWRGVVAGILEQGLETLRALSGHAPGSFLMHLGPAICGACYEVGPEVQGALGLPAPGVNAPVDLRALLFHRAVQAGLQRDLITQSAFCTRCDHAAFYSHRGGDRERQMGLLGLHES